MFDKLLNLLKSDAKESEKGADPLHLATAALMIEIALADGHASDDELAALKASMASEFGLKDADIDPLIEEARSEAAEALDVYKFTRIVAAELDQEGRQQIVKLLWQVALVDDTIENFEENALAKIAGLLGVRPADRVRLKQEVMTERAQRTA